MKCYQHPDIDAVAQCSKCSKGLCRPCADEFVTVLCQTCAQEIRSTEGVRIKKYLADQKWQKIKAIISIAWAVFMMIVGVWATAASPKAGAEAYMNLIAFFALGGLPWVFGKSKNKPETPESILKDIRNDMLLYSANSSVATGMLMGKAVVALFAVAFSVVVTPFRVVMTILMIVQMKKTRAEMEAALAQCA